ncbi:ATP-dependent nuclease [Glutamicibacter protophormiae]|uniref:ATPase n=1 Tax=Glutamicibacter protophormiae TaxID=37930 RepID=A0ABS4XM71_GLUPR|nr:ATP-dependent endonuclease [Glutamicibacter protophormiae]MBP2397606.1 putative ATPase [Glutamicibacter protophormiae]GGL77842.1 ATP-dependent endonuclease [Glutamicibacter protophormiae]
MKISQVKIKNYRSLKDLDLKVDDYTALIGSNGSGKSSVLYALSWFFSGKGLEQTDVHEVMESSSADEKAANSLVSVSVSFSDLTDADRQRLAEYGRGKSVTFTRSWSASDGKSKVVGNALAGPGFAHIRQLKLIKEIRDAYNGLRVAGVELPDLGAKAAKDAMLQALVDWEDEPANSSQLELVDGADANHMFGINGANVINECVRIVLVPAATDISSQVGDTGKGSTLADLIGGLMANAGAAARSEWQVKNAKQIEELNAAVRTSVEQSTGLQAKRINARLASLIPTAKVEFTPTVPDWSPKGEASVLTNVSIDGLTNDVSRQGHGVQRAVMIAMFQSLVPDAELMLASHERQEDESEDEAQLRLAEELEKLPCLIVAIEEPEIYQHPIRARAFARVLAELSAQFNVQVLVATHSPYFVRPDQFESLRRFTLAKGVSEVNTATLSRLAVAAGCDEARAQKTIQLNLPTAFSEGFFADSVVLVEGETDKVVLESLAELLNSPLDGLGISVLDMSSKDAIQVPFAMLSKELGVPAYVMVDGDALGAARKHSDPAKAANARNSHKKSTETICGWLPDATACYGTLPYTFGSPTVVTDNYTIWEDDIEEELAKWPSFLTVLQANGGALREKNVLAYRAALLASDVDEMPASLKESLAAIIRFRESALELDFVEGVAS